MAHKSKELHNEYNKAWREKNKNKIIDQKKLYYKNNRTKVMSHEKEYYEKNKEKISAYKRSHEYGMTAEEYDNLFELQGRVCAICGEPETAKHQSGNIKRLCVDHDHETGKIRGLLCHRCNLGIGMLKDSPRILSSAIAYLEKFNIH